MPVQLKKNEIRDKTSNSSLFTIFSLFIIASWHSYRRFAFSTLWDNYTHKTLHRDLLTVIIIILPCCVILVICDSSSVLTLQTRTICGLFLKEKKPSACFSITKWWVMPKQSWDKSRYAYMYKYAYIYL